MTLIDGDRIITAELYDDEYEEFIEKKMSIIDFVNAYTDEGVTTADDVLDKIRAEIDTIEEGITSYHNDRPWVFKDEVLQIIDKYKAEGSDKE